MKLLGEKHLWLFPFGGIKKCFSFMNRSSKDDNETNYWLMHLIRAKLKQMKTHTHPKWDI